MPVFFTRRGEPPFLGKKLSDYAIGEHVFLNVNGTPYQFLVVNQGIPSNSSLYDSSCNGTWLMMKDLYDFHTWDAGNSNNYKLSDVSIYLNGDFVALFDSAVQNTIKQVKIPYGYLDDSSQLEANVNSGANGADVKIFLPSTSELGYDHGSGTSFHARDGANLAYFANTSSEGTDSKRIAYFNGEVRNWHTRTCRGYATHLTYYVNSDGKFFTQGAVANLGVRPTLIMPFDTYFSRASNTFIGL